MTLTSPGILIAGYVHFYLQSISTLKGGANLTAGTLEVPAE